MQKKDYDKIAKEVLVEKYGNSYYPKAKKEIMFLIGLRDSLIDKLRS